MFQSASTFFTPLSSVRRNLLISASLALLVGIFAIDTSEFRFFGIKFEQSTLLLLLLATTSFYLTGYLFKSYFFFRWITGEIENNNKVHIEKSLERISSSFATFDDDRRYLIQALEKSRKEFYALAGVEAAVPLLLGIVGVISIVARLA